MTNDGLRAIAYNPSNKVVEIDSEQASASTTLGTVKFMYGADGNRVVQSVTSGTTNSRTVYVGLGGTGKSLYERTTTSDTNTSDPTGGAVQHVYSSTQGELTGEMHSRFACSTIQAHLRRAGITTSLFGSVTVMSDEQGHVATTQSSGLDPVALGYDAWELAAT